LLKQPAIQTEQNISKKYKLKKTIMARKGCGPYNLGAPKAMATKSIAKQTTYELDYDEDTDNPVGFSGTDASGKHTTSYSYPSNEEITRSRTQVEEGLSDVSDFEEKHKFENDMIWVMKDGRWKPRTDFTAKSGYEFDNPYMQEELRKAGQNASKVHMGNLKSNNPRAYKNLVDAYNRELDR